MRGTVIIFVKAPRAGQVKTRLGAGIGMGRAAALFRIMTERTIAEAQKGNWQVILAVDPPAALRGWDSVWPPHLERVAQGAGDLGDRMKRAFDKAPPGPVVVIGADAPGFRERHLYQGFTALGRADAVFGPATDGGYWLIGLARRRTAPKLFRDVRWSTKHALKDTQKSLPADFNTALLEKLRDIDDAGDLPALGAHATAR